MPAMGVDISRGSDGTGQDGSEKNNGVRGYFDKLKSNTANG